MVTKCLSRFVALSFMCLLPFASAVAQSGGSGTCAEKIDGQFFYDFALFGSNAAKMKRSVSTKISEANQKWHDSCKEFCEQKNCPDHKATHEHTDGSKAIQSGSISDLVAASPVNIISLSGVGGDAAWENILFKCECYDTPSIDPVVQ